MSNYLQAEGVAISQYHAHVYFDETTVEQATALCNVAAQIEHVQRGTILERFVGPHPRWSCQLIFAPTLFGEVVPLLNMLRGGLTVFIHPCTGNDLDDHSIYAMWLGESIPLKLEMFMD